MGSGRDVVVHGLLLWHTHAADLMRGRVGSANALLTKWEEEGRDHGGHGEVVRALRAATDGHPARRIKESAPWPL